MNGTNENACANNMRTRMMDGSTHRNYEKMFTIEERPRKEAENEMQYQKSVKFRVRMSFDEDEWRMTDDVWGKFFEKWLENKSINKTSIYGRIHCRRQTWSSAHQQIAFVVGCMNNCFSGNDHT